VVWAVIGGVLAAAASAPSAQAQAADRKYIRHPDRPASDTRPFSDAVLVGKTLYMAGRTGHDVKTNKLPETTADEARAILDQMKTVLAQADMTMDDLVFVQVFCTDVALYQAFNDVYRTYFKSFPARAYIGSGPLLGGAHFEVQGIAEKR
jgi:enamine deaminase RidA (YjgF/YER057c/UK114 family)